MWIEIFNDTINISTDGGNLIVSIRLEESEGQEPYAVQFHVKPGFIDTAVLPAISNAADEADYLLYNLRESRLSVDEAIELTRNMGFDPEMIFDMRPQKYDPEEHNCPW